MESLGLHHAEGTAADPAPEDTLGDESEPNAVRDAPSDPVVQAHRAPYNETIAPPGGPLSRVIRPPIEFPPESKRAQTIEDAEVDLEEDMDELKAAVHAYNVDFQRRTTLSHFARLEAHEVAAEERKVRECDADFRKFAYTTVPEIMEKLQGTVTRRLDKNHETFDTENAKIQKREKKTLGALESNARKTESNFNVERQRRTMKFQEREEDFHHVMRVDNRDAERKQSNQVVSLQHQLHEESRVRQKEDLEILDKLAALFHQLQASILENLGEE